MTFEIPFKAAGVVIFSVLALIAFAEGGQATGSLQRGAFWVGVVCVVLALGLILSLALQ